MKKQLNRYKFDKISNMMAKEFGKIERGKEDDYNIIFAPMEGNLLKLHREKTRKETEEWRLKQSMYACC